jgi:RHS repeat-associated protein
MMYQSGSLTAMEFPTGSPSSESTKTYDSLGRVVTSADAAGHSLTFSRAPDSATDIQVTKTTGLGVTTQFQVALPATGAQTWTTSLSDGTTETTQVGADGSRTVTAPDGTKTTYTAGPDPRFAMQVPLTKSLTVETPSGLTETTAFTRAVTLSNASNPLSLASETDTTTINGQAWTTAYNASTGTFTATTPVGRTTTTTVNGAGETTQIAMPNIAASVFGYDTHGRPTTTTQGTFVQGTQTFPRTWTQGYDTSGYLNVVADPLGVATTHTNDLAGRPTSTLLPSGTVGVARDLQNSFDGDNNVTSETLPSGALHQFTYTPVDALASYAPPSLGAGAWSTSDAYDGDGRLSLETRPDGSTISYSYDTAGRLITTSYPQGMIQQIYSPTTGQLTAVDSSTGENLSFVYDGFLNKGTTWTGTVAGSLLLGYDSTFRLISQTVNGTALSFGYDNDNLMTQAGALTIARDPQNGRVTGTTLGAVTDAYTYDANGQLASYVATDGSTTLYAETINTRDGDGRITQRTESIGSGTHIWIYAYDTAGRLTAVTEDGTEVSQYTYDLDDNRTTFTNASGTVSATYDAQDRMSTYGAATYAYGANGELQSKTSGGQTTGFTYDVFGNLLNATLPGGTALAYTVDGQNRRVGTLLNGVLEAGLLYQDQLNVIAQLNGSGTVVSRFVFGSKPNVPDYFTSAAGTFRILSDHLGSPKVVVNSSTGSIIEAIAYDEFGNVVSDTQPGLTPFGFAGGLYDQNTGLVRFGARDYDPGVGRWTTKDPAKFGGGINFYVYAGNDPIDFADPSGLLPNLQCVQYLSGICDEKCARHGSPVNGLCFLTCLLAEVGAAIDDPSYCYEPRTAPRCQAVFDGECVPQCTADVLGCPGGPLDKSGNFYSCLRSCMNSNNCQY